MKHRRLLFLSALVVALLAGGSGLWVWRAKRQYALNRQLVAALLHNDSRQALALVNAGADPDTPVASPPAPTLNLLASQLLHRSLQPGSDGLTVFRFACGRRWYQGYDGATHLRALDSRYFDEDLPLLQAMLTHGANVHARIEDNSTVLHDGVSSNRLHSVELLLRYGANVNAQDKRDTTSLMLAGIYDNAAMIYLLLSHGANLNVQNVKGNTVLHMTVVSPVPQSVIPELLVCKADIDIPNKQGETPLTLAQKRKRPAIVALLQKGGK